jgi:hypothetical protein
VFVVESFLDQHSLLRAIGMAPGDAVRDWFKVGGGRGGNVRRSGGFGTSGYFRQQVQLVIRAMQTQDRREVDLDQREQRLNARSTQLDLEETAQNTREAALADREKRLTDGRAQLKARHGVLVLREQKVTADKAKA